MKVFGYNKNTQFIAKISAKQSDKRQGCQENIVNNTENSGSKSPAESFADFCALTGLFFLASEKFLGPFQTLGKMEKAGFIIFWGGLILEAAVKINKYLFPKTSEEIKNKKINIMA